MRLIRDLIYAVIVTDNKKEPHIGVSSSWGRSFCHGTGVENTVSVEVVRILCGLRSQVALSIEKSTKVIHKNCTDGISRDVCIDINKERCNTGITSCHRNRYGKYL